MKFPIFLITLFSVASTISARNQASSENVTVFESGHEGYHTFRIPAIIQSNNGILLAFAEGRKASRNDFGDIDIVLKRSTNGGKSWSDLRIVQDDSLWQVGNPCPVIDRDSGRIFLLFCGSHDSEHDLIAGKGSREIYISYSDDDGQTWSHRRNISAMTKKANWRWYATGPCSGIQIRQGTFKGRLVVPANHSEHTPGEQWQYRSHALYSDDRGMTWEIGASSETGGNETQITEVAPDLLIQDTRMQTHGQGLRAVRFSRDGGTTWSALQHDHNRPCPRCQGSIISLASPSAGKTNTLIASNPAGGGRTGMAIRLSENGGKTWHTKQVLHAGPSAYSGLVQLDASTVGCLFEMGTEHPYEKIVFLSRPIAILQN